MNQMRIVLSRIPACSKVALMFMLIGIIVLSISLSSFFDKIGENIFIDYGFKMFFSIRFFLKSKFYFYQKGQFIRNGACVFWFINCLVVKYSS